jgi:alkanesulfonate monooxygenase SsuD/methylene tetrahydromethanopterin reductase-like flavin-dependent oxidoreductase (luciferase family)
MDFGIFNLMGYREPGKTTAQVLNEATEQTRVADELGFGMSWFAEHHFSNYAICPSPLMMVAHCAPITSRIRLGTGVLVLPLYNPARLTAEIAMADALCNGRLVLGVGSGYQPYEFERFGLNLADSKEMFHEFLDIIELGLSQQFFSYAGQHYRLAETHITPRIQQKRLPIWIAGDSPELHRMAARRGYVPMMAGRTGDMASVIAQRDRCAASFQAEGVPLEQMPIALQRHACVTTDRDEARRFAENALYQIRLTTGLRRRTEVMDGHMIRNQPFSEEPSIETIMRNLLIGDPEHCAEMLAAEIRAANPIHMNFYFQLGEFPHRSVLRSMEMFMTRVVPLLTRELGPLDAIGAQAREQPMAAV